MLAMHEEAMHEEAMIELSGGGLVTAAAAQEDTALFISSQQGVSVDHIPTPDQKSSTTWLAG